jgi:hypothetical protein
VTFLLFVASVALLEYLLQDVRQTGADGKRVNDIMKELDSFDPLPSKPTSTSDLLSLGRAIEARSAEKDHEREPVREANVGD